MKFSSHFIYAFTAVLMSSILNSIAFSQIQVEVPLRAFFKPEPIRKNRIQSLVVFVDLYGEATKNGIQRNGKILEFEFDSTGNMSYKLSVDQPKNELFLDYAGDQRVEYFQFDQRGLLLHLYRENADEIYQMTSTYDENGNMTSLRAVNDDKLISDHEFKWKDRKMIAYSDLRDQSTGDGSDYQFDEQGRVLIIKDGSIQVHYTYSEIEDTIKVTESIVDENVAILVEIYSYHKDFKEHYTQFTSTNMEGELDIKMDVTYDEFGNAASYRLFNRNGKPYEYDKTLSIEFRIENTYNIDGLLTSRKFFSIEKDIETEALVRVERYIYDDDPLAYRFEMGALHDEFSRDW